MSKSKAVCPRAFPDSFYHTVVLKRNLQSVDRTQFEEIYVNKAGDQEKIQPVKALHMRSKGVQHILSFCAASCFSRSSFFPIQNFHLHKRYTSSETFCIYYIFVIRFAQSNNFNAFLSSHFMKHHHFLFPRDPHYQFFYTHPTFSTSFQSALSLLDFPFVL